MIRKRKHRQRLIGAMVVVAAVVILYPFLFSLDDTDNTLTVVIPEAPDAPVIPVYVDNMKDVLNMPAEPADFEFLPGIGLGSLPDNTDQAASTGAATATTGATEQAGETAVAKSELTATPAPASTTVAQAAPKSEPVEEKPQLDADGLPISWALQVASLSDEKNVNMLVYNLRRAGYQTYLREVITSTGGLLFRIYVGPELRKSKILATQVALDKEFNVKSMLVRFRP